MISEIGDQKFIKWIATASREKVKITGELY